MNKKQPIQWTNINKSRKIMLTQSDWTQLPDSGLSHKCVMQWRNWRKELRTIIEDNFNDVLTAVAEISRMDESNPITEHSDDSVFQQEGAVISRIDLEGDIIGIINKYYQDKPPITPVEPLESPTGPPTLDSITNVKLARKLAQSEAERAYNKKIKEKSPAIETFVLYTERLNQSIDFLSETGTNFPLLEVLAESLGEPSEDVANTILKTHNNTMAHFLKIERQYIWVLKMIKDSDNIEDMIKLVEDFNGY